ncbi:MAG: DUF2165 family protein [Pseudomonadota bacterium]
MSETIFLLAQTGLTAALAAWMFTGARDNILYPAMNENIVRMLMQFDLIAEEYPEDFAKVAHRRVENPRLIRIAFIGIVISETIATLVLAVGTIALLGALFGTTEPDTAQAIALLGAFLFTMNWAGFLVGGNHYAIWYCHQGSQHTHFALVIWGTLSMIFLALPA